MVDSFFLNADPIYLFSEFIIDKIKYLYELSLTKDSVVFEKLSRKINRYSTVFVREGNKLTSCVREFNNLKHIKLRSNSSIISSAYQYEILSINPIYSFFRSIISNTSWLGSYDFSLGYREISEYYNKNKHIFKQVVKFLKEFDLGIANISLRKLTDEDNKEHYYPVFEHDANYTNKILTYHSQSSGTKMLYRSFPYYIDTLEKGGILLMDEFDTYFHPHILSNIVSYFDNEEHNRNGAQMIFSTHNTDILEYMGKYRTILVNKESSESYAYRLDEIQGDILRNDRPITPVYNAGKIGGVPKI
jgi:predicted ATP-dependent endonuclease of OLD family